MNYKIYKIEKKWKKFHKIKNFFFKNNKRKKKFYILNMFPYPSGTGLHLGHCIGYIFSDIISKYKKSLNFNVLNPIGFDSFGLPAEQFAINKKKNPEYIIKKSIKKYLKQIKNLGVFFNWNKIINTSKKKYYKWTQWIFIKFFNHYFDKKKKKAINLKFLIKKLKKKGFKKKEIIEKKINKLRLAYIKNSYVNWCPKLKTVLANEEIENGKSIRGGFLIVKKKMKQWHLRITKYIPRLLYDMKFLDWSKKILNSQKKWIKKRKIYFFNLKINSSFILNIFTKKKKIKKIKYIIFYYPSKYIDFFLKFLIIKKNKKKILKKIINNNLLIFKNKKIKIIIKNYSYKEKILKNSKLIFKKKINYLDIKNFFKIKNIKINLKIKKTYIENLNDIVFSRQRYWGEPIPIYYKKEIPNNIPIEKLPLTLPKLKKKKIFKGKIQLKYFKKWAWNEKEKKKVNKNFFKKKKKIFKLDVNTMPSFAGSNWYYLRYMNFNNKKKFLNIKKEKYWKYVDLYIGGLEHINGHLLYSRFCYKFLYDIKKVHFKEPFKKFLSQGLILNYSYKIYIYKKKIFSYDLLKYLNKKKTFSIYIESKYIYDNNKLKINFFKKKKKKYKKFKFLRKKGKNFICKKKLEKMSKSKLNIITPEKIINKYGIDVLRLYLIFLGPFNKNKIWNLKKIKGVKRFLNKVWKYFEKLKKLNKKKIEKIKEKKIKNILQKIIKNFNKNNLNKIISYLMILLKLFNLFKIKNYFFLKTFLILLSFFCPYISEELWLKIGNKKSIFLEKFPYKKEKKKEIKYIIMVNNKKKDIIYLKKKKNNLKYLLKKIKKKNFF
ncbi:MAG: class I tRNA ligase family protein [Candidatus Shikimatogenerans sp. JK-2022]|nr:class I tRNA ligase family protein [Candidatus Shikimatogenerans bostrichidophilus]